MLITAREAKTMTVECLQKIKEQEKFLNYCFDCIRKEAKNGYFGTDIFFSKFSDNDSLVKWACEELVKLGYNIKVDSNVLIVSWETA